MAVSSFLAVPAIGRLARSVGSWVGLVILGSVGLAGLAMLLADAWSPPPPMSDSPDQVIDVTVPWLRLMGGLLLVYVASFAVVGVRRFYRDAGSWGVHAGWTLVALPWFCMASLFLASLPQSALAGQMHWLILGALTLIVIAGLYFLHGTRVGARRLPYSPTSRWFCGVLAVAFLQLTIWLLLSGFGVPSWHGAVAEYSSLALFIVPALAYAISAVRRHDLPRFFRSAPLRVPDSLRPLTRVVARNS